MQLLSCDGEHPALSAVHGELSTACCPAVATVAAGNWTVMVTSKKTLPVVSDVIVATGIACAS